MRVLILLLLSSPPAVAETDLELIEQGLALREKGQDADALVLFQKAYALSPSGRALAQIGLAEQALAQWVDAEGHLVEALAMNDSWVEERRAPIEGALDTIRRRIAKVDIVGTAGATVEVNGKSAGTLPLAGPARVEAGSILVKVAKDGYRTMSKTIEAAGGSLWRERFDLIASETASAPPPPPPLPSAPPPPPTTVVTAERGGPDLVIWGIAAGAGAVAGLAVGIAGVAIRNANVAKYNDDAQCLTNGLSREVNCKKELDASFVGERMAIGGFVAGGALGVASILLFVFDGGDDETVAVGPGPGDLGVAVGGRF